MTLCPMTLWMLLVACGPWMTEGDYFHVEREGAILPVWVNGDLASDVFIVTLHGGPGDAGHEFPLSEGFQRLEEDYAVVYWDQRMSGMSQGNPSMDTVTLEDYVADADAVISVIQEKYGITDFILYGHSWGGDLGLAYLLDGDHRGDVAAYIDHGGTHDEPFAIAESREWILERIDGYLADGTDVEFWGQAGEYYAQNPVLLPSDPVHGSYVSRAGGYYYDPAQYEEPSVLELAFASPFSMGFYQNVGRSLRLSQALLDDFVLTDRLGEITTPILVHGGMEDGIVPPSVLEETWALVGTPEGDRRLSILPEVAHSSHFEAPDDFVAITTDFIEAYAP